MLLCIDIGNTHVVLGVARFRRQATGIVAGRAAVALRHIVQEALTAVPTRRRQGNVVLLRPYAVLGHSA